MEPFLLKGVSQNSSVFRKYVEDVSGYLETETELGKTSLVVCTSILYEAADLLGIRKLHKHCASMGLSLDLDYPAEHCATCGKEATHVCSRCKAGRFPSYYCDKNCQQSDWKEHKKLCKMQAAPLQDMERVAALQEIMLDPRVPALKSLRKDLAFLAGCCVLGLFGSYRASGLQAVSVVPRNMPGAGAFIKRAMKGRTMLVYSRLQLRHALNLW